MADSSSSESSSISGSDYSDFEASMEVQHNERFMNLLVKLGPGNLNRQDKRNLKKGAIVRRGSRARDASILCDSEFRAQALVRQNSLQ